MFIFNYLGGWQRWRLSVDSPSWSYLTKRWFFYCLIHIIQPPDRVPERHYFWVGEGAKQKEAWWQTGSSSCFMSVAIIFTGWDLCYNMNLPSRLVTLLPASLLVVQWAWLALASLVKLHGYWSTQSPHAYTSSTLLTEQFPQPSKYFSEYIFDKHSQIYVCTPYCHLIKVCIIFLSFQRPLAI